MFKFEFNILFFWIGDHATRWTCISVVHGPHPPFEIHEISLDARGTRQGGRSKDLRWEVDTAARDRGRG